MSPEEGKKCGWRGAERRNRPKAKRAKPNVTVRGLVFLAFGRLMAWINRSVVCPFRDAARRPGRARRFHRLFQPCQVTFDQSAQGGQRRFKISGGGSVMILLRAGRARGRHALFAENRVDPVAD